MKAGASLFLVLVLAGCVLPAGFIPQPYSPTPARAPATSVHPQAQPMRLPDPPTPGHVKQLPTPTPERCTVQTGQAGGTVNVRGGPGMEYAVIGVVHEGDELITTGPNLDGWRQITTKNFTGWFYIERWCKGE